MSTKISGQAMSYFLKKYHYTVVMTLSENKDCRHCQLLAQYLIDSIPYMTHFLLLEKVHLRCTLYVPWPRG